MQLYPETRKALFKAAIAAGWLSSVFYTTSAYAVSVPDLETMLINFATSVPNLMRLVTAISYVLGLFFVAAALMGMKHFGEMRTMMSHEHGISGPLAELFVGIALLYLPSSIQVGLSTFWVVTNPYAYLNNAVDQYTTFVNACYAVIELVGVIAFIRGLLILKQLGTGRGHGQATLGKAMAHIVGGILCINMYNTIQMFATTVGWNS